MPAPDGAATAKPVSATPSGAEQPVPNKRNPARRLFFQALILAAITAFGVWTVTLPWYTFSLPVTTIVDANLTETPGVYASGSITGWELTHQVSEPADNMGTPLMAAPTPGSVLGLPQPAFLLLISGTFGFLAAVLRQGFVGIVGLFALPMAWKQLVTFRSVVEDPNFGGQFNQMAYGLAWMQWSLLLSFVVLFLLTAQVLVVNHKRRKAERELAIKEGRPVTANPFEIIQALVMPSLHRLQEQSEKRIADAKKADAKK